LGKYNTLTAQSSDTCLRCPQDQYQDTTGQTSCKNCPIIGGTTTYTTRTGTGDALTGKTSISDCYHLIHNASCFITMDSGLLHLAGTTNTPIIH
jgi:ADP-heptose:LPS heptosyltransferase